MARKKELLSMADIEILEDDGEERALSEPIPTGFNWTEYLEKGFAEIEKVLADGDDVNARRVRVNLDKAKYWSEKIGQQGE